MNTEQYTEFLSSLGVAEDTASESQKSDATAFSTCYDWYINKQKVLPENASLAAKIWVQKYALHNSDNICLESTPEDMWDRIANVLAKIELQTNKKTNKSREEWKEIFYSVLKDFAYTPQGSGMFSIGNPFVNASASNCFVWDGAVHGDSLEGIFETAKNLATIYKYRGGCGTDLSHLRPANTQVNNAAKTSSGAASFMDFFSNVTSTVGQFGRRGALLESIRIDHPDIELFIDEKRDLDKQWFFNELADAGINFNDWKYSGIASRLKSTSNANVSVKLTNKFIKAVEEDKDFELWYEFENNKYPRISKFVSARKLWHKLIASATASAEPGLFNWDFILKESIPDCYAGNKSYKIDLGNGEETVNYNTATITSNPCGELLLSHGDSCCIGSFYLSKFVKNPWTNTAYFDYTLFKKYVEIGTRMQDNIKFLDISKVPLKENKIAAILLMRIGLGCHGLADTLAALGFKYDSPEALLEADKIYSTLKNTAYETSVILGQEKGVFPIWDWKLEKNNPFLNRLDPEVLKKVKKFGRRNIAILTNAPTGSVSILSRNCSSGIEPVFKKSYLRNVKIPGSDNVKQYEVFHQAVQDCIDSKGDPSVFIEANEVNGYNRIEMQAKIQSHIDHSVSVTTNLPAGTTEEYVSKLYLHAFHSGCKGCTVYVEGSRSGVLVSAEDSVKKSNSKILERPKTTDIAIHKTKYKEKNYMILIGKIDGQPIEVFGGEEPEGLSLPTKYHKAELTKKSRGHYSLTVWLSDDEDDVLKINNIGNRFPAGDIITLTRMISLSLRNGIKISDIVEQLSKSSNGLYDAPAVFARVLKQYVPDEDLLIKEKQKGKLCPDCGEPLDFKRESGCLVELCTSCNYSNSKCG